MQSRGDRCVAALCSGSALAYPTLFDSRLRKDNNIETKVSMTSHHNTIHFCILKTFFSHVLIHLLLLDPYQFAS